MTPPSISVALATYNGERYLAEQLESIQNQTLCPSELVVSDDCSTDRTRDMVEDFSRVARFPVRLLAQPKNLGFRRNFLKAAQACRSDIVSFCDQDDIWSPAKLQSVSTLMGQEPEVMLCFHNSRLVGPAREPFGLYFGGPPCAPRVDRLTLDPQFRPLGYSQSLRAELLQLSPYCLKTGDWLEKGSPAAHDMFFFCLASSIGRIAYIDQPLVEYRQHGGNAYGASLVAPRRRTLDGLRKLFLNSSSLLRRYGEISKQYADAARAFGDLSADLPKGAIDEAVESWHLLSHAYRLRSDVRGGASFFARCRAFRELCRMGCYGEKGFWTSGKKAGVEDLLAGVILGAVVRRLGAEAIADGNMRKSRRRDAGILLTGGFSAY